MRATGIILFVLLSFVPPPGARAQSGTGDYGDAPENVLAYPSSGTLGSFPTCLAGPSGLIFHWANPGGNAWFGPSVDLEPDGNASLNCNYLPYDNDECGGPTDPDAGLLGPDAFTIVGGMVVPCSPPGGRPLAMTCTRVQWGPNSNLDMVVTNMSPSRIFFVNALFDWDQNGVWGGSSLCPGILSPIPEWSVVNIPVPPLFSGLLSSLAPPPFYAGPRPGHVWSRFTISDFPISGTTWDGSGNFEAGESEDYLLRLNAPPPPGEFGDAPEGAAAYPPAGVLGRFPTLLAGAPTTYIHHMMPTQSWFGGGADMESDGNAGLAAFPPYDLDECSLPVTPDAGILRPDAYTLDALGNYVTCAPGIPPGTELGLGWSCLWSHWGPHFDLLVTNVAPSQRYLNLLFDWNQDGAWGGTSTLCALPSPYPEHVIQNLPVPAGFSGPLSQLISGTFLVPAATGFVWVRASVMDQPVVANWDGSGTFGDGETEDYLLRVDSKASGTHDAALPDAGPFMVEPVWPNPAPGPALIAWRMPAEGTVRVTLLDVSGRTVRTLLDETRAAGPHVVEWDGRDDLGRLCGAGLYFARVARGHEVRVVKIVRAR